MFLGLFRTHGYTLFIGVSKEGDIEGLASHAGSAWR
jgi:hypothetical protein